jgi:hypothetical protein
MIMIEFPIFGHPIAMQPASRRRPRGALQSPVARLLPRQQAAASETK